MSDREAMVQSRFGLPGFRPWQREAVDELLEGTRKVLVVAPTGGGKSLCYQFPATELPGTSLVVSPLIALMEDQVRGLNDVGVPATWLSSTVDADERRTRLRRMMRGEYKLVYIAPERLALGGTLDMLQQLRPPLVAIDEAHCISQWGHDFRPDYLRLRDVLHQLRPAHVLACTATATPVVRDEIVKLLGLSQAETSVILRGFARPNLHLAVEEVDESSRRRTAMVAALKRTLGDPAQPAGAAIVYAATRKNVEHVAEVLRGEGYDAAPYHAGLDGDVRAGVNERFTRGQLDVVVATNAFGMGIDRPDIRAVIHIQAPGSVEAYYQEVGRAGRDGQPAHGLLICSSADFGLRRRLIEGYGDRGARDAEHVLRQWGLFLDLMRYVEAGSCRHDFILEYFGDVSETLGGCGHCDVCEMLEEGGNCDPRETSPSEEDAQVVLKALSGVARARQRVGLNAVAEMLRGADNKQQRRLGFKQLSTYGLLSDRPKPWIQALLRRLLTAGLIDITPDEYPLVYLTARGMGVMQGSEPARVLLPAPETGQRKKKKKRKGRKPSVAAVSLTAEEQTLFERLRETRSKLASARGVPAYIICHDRTLAEMAQRRPTTTSELAEVHGMGPARLSAYGETFLAVVDQ